MLKLLVNIHNIFVSELKQNKFLKKIQILMNLFNLIHLEIGLLKILENKE